jgi:Tfp pilus assembly protein PilF
MKTNRQFKLIVRVLIILSVLFFNINTLMAVAFPFREFDEGDPVPDVTLKSFQDGQPAATFSGLKGKPDPAAVINEVVDKSKSTIKVYLDENQKAYATLGIFVMPTVLLVDKDGNVAAGMGYSRDLMDRLKGAVEIMLGEKTAEQVAAELRPEMIEISAEEKASRRHFDFGMVMLKRGQLDAAIREFGKAVEVDPGMSKAHLQLGCLYLGNNELENAEKSINKTLEADPDSVNGKICRGELLRLKGELEQAAKELQAVITSHPEKYDAYYYLGRVFEDQKKEKEAMDMYKKGYKLILKHSVAGK